MIKTIIMRAIHRKDISHDTFFRNSVGCLNLAIFRRSHVTSGWNWHLKIFWRWSPHNFWWWFVRSKKLVPFYTWKAERNLFLDPSKFEEYHQSPVEGENESYNILENICKFPLLTFSVIEGSKTLLLIFSDFVLESSTNLIKAEMAPFSCTIDL